MDGKLMLLCPACAENLSQIRKVTLRKYLFGNGGGRHLLFGNRGGNRADCGYRLFVPDGHGKRFRPE